MEKKIICTVCPLGCCIQVTGDEHDDITDISGFSCKRGEIYARQEFICPMRILTGTVRIDGAEEPLLPVRSASPIPLKLIPTVMQEMRKIRMNAPIQMHQIIIADVLGTGVDIIASACME
ncbi:MAG: DUF1667 domain-containing protein [Lentisphaerae bacterium]|nr:DUF1667 domain-containing protein [Lentisphaerota bacterium]